MSLVDRLIHDAKHMGIEVSVLDAARLVQLLDELEKWNRTYNLTAITRREDMVTHHSSIASPFMLTFTASESQMSGRAPASPVCRSPC